MKIAMYVQDMRASGVVRNAIAMARFLTQEPDEIILVAGYEAGIFGRDDVAPARFAVATQRPPAMLPRLRVVPHLRRTLRELKPDIILSHGNFGHFSLWAASRGLGLPIVYVFSNAMERAGQPWRNRWRRFWSGLLMNGSAGAILVGSGMARSGVFQPHVARGKAVVIPNGIDLQSVPEAGGPPPEAMLGPEPVILSIGRLTPQKNFEGLIDAVAVARRSRPVRLVILGAGKDEYRQTLVDRANERGIGEHVLFAGVTDNVYPWLRAARVFALASHWEGSSIALLEAMAAGAPIVASRTAGDAPDVLDGGRYGLLADPGDAEAFATALLRQIDSPVMPGERIRDFDSAGMMRAYHTVLMKAARPQPDGPGRALAETRPSR